MRISGTEPSSVILSQKIVSKVGGYVPNRPKQAEAKGDGVINPQNYNLKQFLHEKKYVSSYCYGFSDTQKPKTDLKI